MLLQADSRHIPLADGSVHCVICSPPYWGLRDYGTAAWEGGDPACDHLGPPKRTQAGFNERYFGRPFDEDKQSELRTPYRDTCGKCGARRVDSQLGLEGTPAEFVAAMVRVFREVKRVLRHDGTLWLNLGDSYASGEIGRHDTLQSEGICNGKAGVVAKRGIGAERKQIALDTGVRPKNLIGIPWRVALALQQDGADWQACLRLRRAGAEVLEAYGDDPIPDRIAAMLDRWRAEYRDAKGDSWYLRSDIIWAKPNPMPESVTDRPTKSHEYLFLLSKRERYFYDADAVRIPSDRVNSGGGHKWASLGNGGIETWEPNPSGANMRSVLTIPTESFTGAHFATFPRKLVEPCVRAGTSQRGVCPRCGAPWERVVEELPEYREWAKTQRFYGEGGQGSAFRMAKTNSAIAPTKNKTTGWRPTCAHNLDPVPATIFDPFIGSGTTIVVANALGRRGVGCDLSSDYLRMARRRIERPHARTPRPQRDDGPALPLFAGME